MKIVEFVARDRKVTSKLPEALVTALMALQHGKEIPCYWEATSDVADDLTEADKRVSRYTSAFAAKDRFDDPKQLNIVRVALAEAKEKSAAIVSKAMNAEANKLRQGLKTLNDANETDKYILSVDTKNRAFVFTIEAKPNVADEADAILTDLGL